VDIDVRFEVGVHNDSSKFDGKGGTLAHAFFPHYGGAVHFDDDEQWALSGSSGTHLETVALHELGHSLGLSHSNVKGSVMYPTYAGIHVDLSDDDRAAIQELYGAPAKSTHSPVTSTRPPVSTTTVVPTSDTSSASLCHFPVDTSFCAAHRDCYFISGKSLLHEPSFSIVNA
jgi:matrix metalloproteinase-14 (membrane-inserted)